MKNTQEKIERVTLVDLLRKTIVVESPNTNNATIDISTLSKGIYFARIESNIGTKTVKVIKD